MSALLLLTGGARGLVSSAIAAFVSIGIVLSLASVYDRLIDDPRVRREAKFEFVIDAEKAASVAQIQETKRQSAAVQVVNEKFSAEIAQLEADQSAKIAKITLRNFRNEKLLRDKGRACTLDDSDIIELLKP
ncbi:MAG: hypothetical protein ACEQSB_00380 [Undibacterium sp.]